MLSYLQPRVAEGSTKLNADLSFLDFGPKHPTITWIPASVAFIGPENYELHCVEAEAAFEIVENGFKLQFQEPFHVESELLMGNKADYVHIYDIRIRLAPGITLSVSRMNPGKYPKALKRGESIGID